MVRAHYEVVVAAFFGHFTSIAFMYTSGIFIPAWQQEWPDASKAELSAAISAWMGCFMGSGLISGKLIPKYGHRTVELVAGTLIAAAWAGASFAQQPWQLYPVMALQGLGAGHVWSAINSLIPTHFPQSRAKMAGFATSGAGVGSLIIAEMHNRLLATMDWRQVCLVTGAIYFVIGLLVAAAMVPAPKAGSTSFKKTESMTMRELLPLPPLLKDPVFQLLAASFVILGLGFFGVMPLVDDHRQELGCGADTRTAAYGAFGVLSIVGRLLSGALGDKFSPAGVWGFLLLIYSFIVVGLAFVPSCGLFAVAVGGVGLFSGPFASLFVPMCAELFGLERVPQALGYLFAVNGASGFLSSVIGGRIRDLTGDYSWSFVFYATVAAIGASNVLFNVRIRHMKRLKQRKARFVELMAAQAADVEAPKEANHGEEETSMESQVEAALGKLEVSQVKLEEDSSLVAVYKEDAKTKMMLDGYVAKTREEFLSTGSADGSTAAPSSIASSRRASKESSGHHQKSTGLSSPERDVLSRHFGSLPTIQDGVVEGHPAINTALVELVQSLEAKMKAMETVVAASQEETRFLRSELAKTQAELDLSRTGSTTSPADTTSSTANSTEDAEEGKIEIEIEKDETSAPTDREIDLPNLGRACERFCAESRVVRA